MMISPQNVVRFAALLLLSVSASAQNTSQQLAFAGIRSVTQQDQINGVQADSAGNLYLLLDQKDGVRLLKTDNAASQILAQTLLGARGDIGVALALDPSGNVYVTGTTTSSSLTATPGAAIPSRTDSSTQSFVAKFDGNLNPSFVTFTGGSRIAAAALAVTTDAVFVTGVIYSANLPVTPSAIQRVPASGSSQNGFVERFNSSGTTLAYATYLTGASGDTTPAAIAADTADNAYIAGSTSAPGFPSVAALVPVSLSLPSGFLTRLAPAGDIIGASSFIPGSGLSSLAIDPLSQTLLASGSIALGQFPVTNVQSTILPNTTYQVLLRMPLDLSAVVASSLLAPGIQSFLASASAGQVWVDGTFTSPQLPFPALATVGPAYAIRVNAQNTIDQTARLGGLPNGNPSFASLPSTITAIAVDAAGEALVAGAVEPTASSSLLATQTYDLPLRNVPTATLPSAIKDAELTAANCNGSLCAGSAAYLAKLTPTAGPALSLSAADLPLIVLRNLGTREADGLTLAAVNATISSNCPTILAAGSECSVLLAGNTAGTLTAASSNGGTQSVTFPAYTASSGTLAFSPKELDFGFRTATSPAATLTITVTNLGSTSQTFTSAIDANNRVASPFSESASDCTLAGANTQKLLAPGQTCHITLAFTPYASAASDGPLTADWSIGQRDVLLTAFSQAGSLSLSAAEIDFGTQYASGIRLPRYLYLSNPSANPISHAPLALPASSPFTLTDACPATLMANSVCQVRIDYVAKTSNSNDSQTLTADQGLSVLLTGQTVPAPSGGGTTVNPSLSVTPSAITFPAAVVVTGVSTAQTVAISNTGASPFTLALALNGDFTYVTSCPATLPPAATCAVAITFAPTQPGVRQGTLSVTAGAGTSPAYVTLSGTGTAILPANNGALDFGGDPVGEPETQFYKIAVPFSALTVSTTGPYTAVLAEDTGYGHGQPAASTYSASFTAACHNCYLGIRFLPSAAGSQAGTITLSSTTGGSTYSLALTGTGTPLSGLILTPATQDFGTIPVHSSSAPTTFTLTNLLSSGASVTLAPTLTGDFSLLNAPTGSQACTGTLAYTASCSIQVAFTPMTFGTRTGILTFTTPSGAAAANLTGAASADPSIAFNPAALVFANVPGPTATQQTVTVTNTGSAAVKVGTPSLASTAFHAISNCAVLAPAASCTIAVTFTPGAATVQDTLSIPINSTTYTLPLTSTYTASNAGLEITPALSIYGPSAVGLQSVARQFTVSNSTAKSLTLSLNVPRQYILLGASCTTLAPGQSCTVSVAFLPLTNGDIPGTLLLQAFAGDGSTLTSVAYVEGYGNGIGSLSLTGGLIVNHAFNFNQVTSGQTSTQTFTVTNTSATNPLTVRRITSAPPFLSTTTCGTPLTPAQTCSVSVTYSPSNQVAVGTASPPTTTDAGVLAIESDAASSPDILNLFGQAGPVPVAMPTPSATLATFTLSNSSLTFASTQVGNASTPQTVTLTNTGSQTLHIASIAASPDFTVTNSCSQILPASFCTFAVASTPQSSGMHVASLQILSDSATSLEFISLLSTATPSPLTVTPGSLDFGSLLVGTPETLPVTLTNSGTMPFTFTSLSASGDYSVGGSCPAAGSALAASASCTAQITFAPIATGTRMGTFSIATSASTFPFAVPLTGIGTQSHLVISPAALAFGTIAIGSNLTQQLTLTNTGSAAVTNLAVSVTGDYVISSACGSATLAPGASCTVGVTFAPTAAGPRPGSVTVSSFIPAGSTAVPLTGTGLQPGGSFSLSASPTTATAVSGQPATYTLTLTPSGGFAGNVALTCTPLAPAQYATCSLLPSSVTLASGPQNSTVTINTITSLTGAAKVPRTPSGQTIPTIFFALFAPFCAFLWRDRRSLRRHGLLLAAMFFCAATLIGCSGGTQNFSLRYTDPGAYQFQITAASTTGSPITESVTLTLTVTPR